MDFIDDALKRYNTKMAMPQYEAYQNNEQMQQALWEDCLREAEFTAECRSRRENAYRFNNKIINETFDKLPPILQKYCGSAQKKKKSASRNC